MTPPKEIIINTERRLLGVLIRDGERLPTRLNYEYFTEPKHREIALAMAMLDSDRIQIDELTVCNRLESMRVNVRREEVAFMVSEAGFCPMNPHWAKMIESNRLRSKIASRLQDINGRLMSGEVDGNQAFTMLRHLASNESQQVIEQSGRDFTPSQMLATEGIDDPDNLLGNRWMCKGFSLVIAGQAGTGKSSLMLQACVRWTLGKDFFGIRPKGPMRTLVIQAENSLFDMARCFNSIVRANGFAADDIDRLDRDMRVVHDSRSTAGAFADRLRQLIDEHKPAMVFIDPLMAYVGMDICDASEASRFFRGLMDPIADETGVVLVFMHHTTKPVKGGSEGTLADLAYALYGSSEITNYAREIMVLSRCQGDEPIFRLSCTKRRAWSGMRNIDGNEASTIYLRHSPNKGEVRWVPSAPPVSTSSDAGR